jgi:hypothetical protein
MTPRSESILAQVDPNLSAKVHAAAATLEPKIYLCAYSGLRTAAQQNQLWAQGRTAPGQVVTNAKAGQSNHNYGLAVDIVPYAQGDEGALNWDTTSPEFTAMVAAMKVQGLVWGGDWIHFPDYDHFQMPTIPPSPSPAMIADYADGENLGSIWQKAAEGAYA